jgi:retron-type reverse transcriptase
MSNWYSEENLKKAWRFVKYDIKDNFAFDVIEYEDIKTNIDVVISSLSSQLASDRYYPAPLLKVGVPKSEYSVRPGTVINVVDLIVLYAIAQQIVGLIDPILSESVYAYRLNPRAGRSGEHLFRHKEHVERESEDEEEVVEEIDDLEDLDFPYNWFENWIQFHQMTTKAAEEYQSVAVTDITAYFENISLAILRDIVKGKMQADDEASDLVDRIFHLMEYWDWNPTGNLPTGIGLLQGNDVSSFLSNLYLIQLDEEMLRLVDQDTNKYYRYVDDVRLYTNNRNEAVQGLVTLEASLRRLNLNIQSKKTEIKSSQELIDPIQEQWMERLSDDNENRHEHALSFIEDEFSLERLDELDRPFRRCLTVLKNSQDDSAVDISMELFLSDPSLRISAKTFSYLRSFITDHDYTQGILDRLDAETFIFPYHRAMLYRLAAYCRGHSQYIVQLALNEAIDTSQNWYPRMAALFCLSTFCLEPDELAVVDDLLRQESDSQVIRAAFLVMAQHSGDQLRWVLDQVSLLNSPYQDYLRRYFFRMYKHERFGIRTLRSIDNATLNAPTFIINLHKLDLLKANRNQEQRDLFLEVISRKLKGCPADAWPRLHQRLHGISNAFAVGA